MSLIPSSSKSEVSLRPFGFRLLTSGFWLLLFALVIAVVPGSRAQDAELEYKVKAAFIFNFISFVEWPTNKLAAADTVVLVGCLPEDPAAPILARALEGKVAEGRKIKFVVLKGVEEVGACHLLFLGREQKSHMDGVLAGLKGSPVLTVSELEGFGQRGGMINFVRHERTFRFEVNLGAAERVGLRISSKLASMATIVKTTTPP
jgi:hypothetical protein